jgi:hypothetical protein
MRSEHMKQAIKYEWIQFTKPNKVDSGFNGVTISKSKWISLSQEFCRKNNIKQYHYANLSFEGNILAIGIEFTNAKQPGCVSITGNAQTGSASLRCGNFFKAFGFDAEWFAGNYPYTVSHTANGKPIYVIDLSPYVPIV